MSRIRPAKFVHVVYRTRRFEQMLRCATLMSLFRQFGVPLRIGPPQHLADVELLLPLVGAGELKQRIQPTRSASSGLVPAARAAGSKLASSATAKKIAVVAAIVIGSTGVTP
jgi:hypothetical protein